MRALPLVFFYFAALSFVVSAQAEEATSGQSSESSSELSQERIQTLAEQFNINQTVLSDYVESYNFKCPQELDAKSLSDMIENMDDFSELSIMLESQEKDWRDLYVESRAGIECLTEGVVSNAY